MKNAVFSTLLAVGMLLGIAQPAQALQEIVTTVPAYWIQPDGSIMVYATIPNQCNAGGLLWIDKSLENFGTLEKNVVLAMTKSYKMDFVVDGCTVQTGGTNYGRVTYGKICAVSSYC